MITNTVKGQVKICIALLVVSCLFCINLQAQYTDHRSHYNTIDSLEQILETNPPTGTDLLVIYRNLAWGSLGNDHEKVRYYSLKGIPLAKELGLAKFESFFYSWLGITYYSESQYDTALLHYNSALKATELMKTSLNSAGNPYPPEDIDDRLAYTYGDIGNIYNIQGKYHQAVEYYMKALEIFEKHGWKEPIFNVYGNIGEMYLGMDNLEQAEENVLKAAVIAHEIEDSVRIASSKERLSRIYLQKQDYDKALESALIAHGYYFAHPEQGSRISVLNTLGIIYLDGFNDEKETEKYARQALEAVDIMNLPREKAISLRLLTAIHMKRGEWRKAEQTALEALAADDTEPANTLSLYTVLAKAYAYQGDAIKSAEYFDKHNELQSSWSNKHYQSAIRDMEVKYETEKKDIRIEALAKERRLYLFLTIAGCGGVLLVLSLLFYRNRLHRRQKQLLVTQVALESETAERSRLARDLHDGLGGMLSLVQVNLKDVKGMKVLAQEDAEHFGTALDMLQSSIVELRRVAHHIMPEALIKYGLKTSLQDFILAVPGADFHFFGEEKRLDSNLEAVVYRSAHELINNVLKHASATHLDVQLVQETDRVALTVTDNGKGFDTAQETKGMGLQNIRNRILVYGGQMHIFSDGKSGTEVNIEIPLKG